MKVSICLNDREEKDIQYGERMAPHVAELATSRTQHKEPYHGYQYGYEAAIRILCSKRPPSESSDPRVYRIERGERGKWIGVLIKGK